MPISNAQHLSDAEKQALEEIKQRVSKRFKVQRYILFGSKARGDCTADSDIDLLIVAEHSLSHAQRHEVSDIITVVNLEHDTLFSSVVVDREKWDSRLYSYYPIHVNVAREGVEV